MAEYKGIKAVLRQFYVLLKKILDDTSSALSTKIESVENSLADVKVDADHFEGTLPISKGGTGAITAKAAEYNILDGITEEDSDPGDSTMYAGVYLSPSTTIGKLYKRSALHLWNYIKNKISSVLGLTASSYNGNAKGVYITGEGDSNFTYFQTASSFNNSVASWASYLIANHGNGTTYYHQMIRLPFFSNIPQLQRRESGKLKGWVDFAMQKNTAEFTTLKATSNMRIPTSQPSTLVNGDIWIE